MNTEQKTDQQIDYGMEELIPVVAELTENSPQQRAAPSRMREQDT